MGVAPNWVAERCRLVSEQFPILASVDSRLEGLYSAHLTFGLIDARGALLTGPLPFFWILAGSPWHRDASVGDHVISAQAILLRPTAAKGTDRMDRHCNSDAFTHRPAQPDHP